MELAESVADAGLSAAIKAGLPKGLMDKPAFGDAEAVQVRRSQLTAAELASPLGTYIVNAWRQRSGVATDAEGSELDIEKFKGSPESELLARYLTLKDAVRSTTITPSQFHEARPLGRGSFGAVFLSFKKDTGAPVATKKMLKPIVAHSQMIQAALVEREVLSKDAKWLCLVLTLCPGGDLQFQINMRYAGSQRMTGSRRKKSNRQYPGFGLSVLRFYAASMALGLEAIHQAGYVYRDLKPGNVLLDVSGQVRISDMGLTADISKGPITHVAGTRGYWAPEVIKAQPYTVQPDWFSLGVTMFVLDSDTHPFAAPDSEKIDQKTCEQPIEFRDEIDPELRSLITELCVKSKSERLGCKGGGIDELKQHAFFSGFDWAALAAGEMEAEFVPDPNDINAPSAKDVETFKAPPGATWTEEHQKRVEGWEYFGEDWWDEEAIMLISKRKELAKLASKAGKEAGGGGGGGGCCTVS